MGWSVQGCASCYNIEKFQSLRGFGVGWSVGDVPCETPKPSFQSLRGFGVGWSALVWGVQDSATPFQSLRGFGVGWSARKAVTAAAALPVSIPERVWGGLEPGQIGIDKVRIIGFNP